MLSTPRRFPKWVLAPLVLVACVRFVPVDPTQEGIVRHGNIQCPKPAAVKALNRAEEKQWEQKAEVEMATLRAALTNKVVKEERADIIFERVSAYEKLNYMACLDYANGVISREQYEEFSTAWRDAQLRKTLEDEKHEEQERKQALDGMRPSEPQVVSTNPGRRCNPEAASVVRYLISACDNQRLVCSDGEPLPPSVSPEQYEQIIASLPHDAIFHGTGESTLSDEHKRQIFDFFAALHGPLDSATILLIGRASKQRTRSFTKYRNDALARRRAEAVRKYLVDEARLVPSKKQVKILNYGESTLYMNPRGTLGGIHTSKYTNVNQLNQSAWIFVYDCK
jgi:outer membrane protein OmpA-like peptidoglycan-associated protein